MTSFKSNFSGKKHSILENKPTYSRPFIPKILSTTAILCHKISCQRSEELTCCSCCYCWGFSCCYCWGFSCCRSFTGCGLFLSCKIIQPNGTFLLLPSYTICTLTHLLTKVFCHINNTIFIQYSQQDYNFLKLVIMNFQSKLHFSYTIIKYI